MPNHVTNEISVIGGSNKQRLAFIRAITNKHGLLDFNNITRMPKSMHIDESSDVEKMATAIAGKPMTDLFFDDVKTVEEVINSLKERGAESSYIKKVKEQALMRIDNKLRYGFYSWYDWSRVKWGTKWNAYSVEMPVERKRERVKRGFKGRPTHIRAYCKRVFKKQLARHAASGAPLSIRFETAWNCPEPIFHEMARRFPHLELHIRYADEDMGSNCGSVLFKNGRWDCDFIAPRWSEQTEEEHLKWRKFAFQVRYPGDTPQQHGMNDEYEYVDD
ncbi:hypothetical protein AHN18_004025 [Salmonella enterica subsp. enterica]|nr:hypothetical protein [Salmonella enterica subsp. enterica]